MQSQEKRKPGTMSKVFSTHPPTDDRIKAAQKNIQEMLKAKPEYVVSTSEFNDVKTRVMAMHNRRKVDNSKDPGRPTLRRNPNGQIDANGDEKAAARRSGRSPDPEAPRRQLTAPCATIVACLLHCPVFAAIWTSCPLRWKTGRAC